MDTRLEQLPDKPHFSDAHLLHRYEQDRLTGPTLDSRLVSLLARQLDHNQGELIVQLSAHNLNSHSTIALFESQDPSFVAPTDFLLPTTTVNSLVAALATAATELGAVATLLHNPFDLAGHYDQNEGSGVEGRTETEHSLNPDEVRLRWRGKTVRVLVRRIPSGATELNETRVAVVGNVDAGKSSLLGVLTKGRLDDGRGRARVSLFRHKHEIESGRTSSVGLELLGFDPAGKEIVPESHVLGEKSANILDPTVHGMSGRAQKLSWEDIAAKASRIVSFSDLAGHERYLKTTLFGLTSSAPDFVTLIVGANAGLIGMSKGEWGLGLAVACHVGLTLVGCPRTPLGRARPLGPCYLHRH